MTSVATNVRLRTERTGVRPAEVHKLRAENVWLDSAQAVSARTMSAAFRVPTTPAQHARFAELLEVQRQVGMLQLARQADLPDSDVFILNQISLRLLGNARTPAQGIGHSHIVSAAATGAGKRSFHQHFGFETADGLVATGRAYATFVPQVLYKRLRSSPPALATAEFPREDGGQEPLTFSREDPILRDHPSDHITAMQVAVAVEDAVGRRRPGTKLAALHLTFEHYIEVEPAPSLAVDFGPEGKFSGSVSQIGVPMASFAGVLVGAEALWAA